MGLRKFALSEENDIWKLIKMLVDQMFLVRDTV